MAGGYCSRSLCERTLRHGCCFCRDTCPMTECMHMPCMPGPLPTCHEHSLQTRGANMHLRATRVYRRPSMKESMAMPWPQALPLQALPASPQPACGHLAPVFQVQ
jgi:hypothetical protein